MAAPDRPRFLFEPGHVRIGARGAGGIKQGGAAGGGGKGGGGAKGGGQGRKGRGQAGTSATVASLAAAFSAISAARGPAVASPVDVASLTLLSTTTLSAPGTFDVSGISGAFNDLVVVVIGRQVNAGVSLNSLFRLNNDSGANYTQQQLRGLGTTPDTTEAVSQSSLAYPQYPASTATAAWFGTCEYIIYGYASTTWAKIIEARSSVIGDTSAGNAITQQVAAIWNSTAAVNRVSLAGNASGNFVTGSQFRVYGRL